MLKKYKIGDRVRVGYDKGSSCNIENPSGEYFTILSCDGTSIYPYWGRFDNEALNKYTITDTDLSDYCDLDVKIGSKMSNYLQSPHHFLNPIKATALAKKMYPDRIEEDGWLL